ncbi:uncharacterized protein DUF1987 [Hypnocyclicus thermotrophus]|uniref:Uncharacterized protein DUF1987 n=1 Tax=Hypnocyclicus thermotrophus TaxID=1627895 RepID=A0AA46I5C8_9FUSO|nr:DUF1987 domain-containing protein [Hypnocyclicus thermotrophus]TDT69198.1 uncharacterized protein DUF1987 [Hypnocyclicus thermotrophus]
MEDLFIRATKYSPEIHFNISKSKLIIKGESYPENSFEFYTPLFTAIKNYFSDTSNNQLSLEIYLTYLNTSSSKCIMNIFDILELYHKKNNKDISLIWFYDEDNEEIVEIIEEFKEDVSYNFEIKKLEE